MAFHNPSWYLWYQPLCTYGCFSSVVSFRTNTGYLQRSCLGGFCQWSQISHTGIHSPQDLLTVSDRQNPEFWARLDEDTMKAGSFTETPLPFVAQVSLLPSTLFGGCTKAPKPGTVVSCRFDGGTKDAFTFHFILVSAQFWLLLNISLNTKDE